jgi:hypothetical protein
MRSAGMIYIPRFMRTGKGVEGILRSFLSNSKSCNIGIIFFISIGGVGPSP